MVNVAAGLFFFACDSAASDKGVAPYNSLSDLYRDAVHMAYGNGQYLMNNLMRLAL